MGFRNKLKNKKFFIQPTFVLLFLWFILTKNLLSFLLFCVVILSHELGHFYIAKKLGYKLNSFTIAPYGVSLNYKDTIFDSKDEVKIALAGPFMNFVLAFLIVSLWWLFPVVYNWTYEFVFQSLMLGLFNLLPCYPLDGGRTFAGILSSSLTRKKAIKIVICLNIVFSCLLFILFVISCFINFNPSFSLCGAMLLLGVLDYKNECKYQPIVLYKKKTKNFSKPFFLTIQGSTSLGEAIKHIELNKFTIFIIECYDHSIKLIDENKLKLYTMKFPLSKSFNEILFEIRK